MTLGMHAPIPGGSQYDITYEAKQREIITIHLPPVGFTIDRMPNPETGVPSYELVKCEIIGADLPVAEQKWKRPELPKDWPKWIAEEKRSRKYNKDFVHPEAEKFRAREWTRRVNGCWLALGNKNRKTTEYVYIPPSAYLYFAWWKADFGFPRFRVIYLELFHTLQWSEDHPLSHGVLFATKRRFGKTAIAGCWTFDKPSQMPGGYGAMQAQNSTKAAEFFDINLMQPFRRLVKFFQPVYDPAQSQKKQLVFLKAPPKGKKKLEEDENLLIESPDEVEPLGGRITCVTSSSGALDGKKLHRFWADEPAKWRVDVEETVQTYIPCTEDDMGNKIGQLFLPTTIEKFENGGREFVSLAEKSFPSMMKTSPNGKTESGLIFLFGPAFKAFVFDEFGRSVIEDPKPGEKIYGEDGKLITEGAKTKLMKRRKSKTTEADRIQEIRKYPWTWFEAKMQAATQCVFNAEILTKRVEGLYAMPHMPWVRGNYEYSGEPEESDVEFIRNDINGRFQVAWQPDASGGMHENSSKIINNIDFEWYEKKKLWFPRGNDRLFSCGMDPFKYKTKGDTRKSNGGAYIFRKYDPAVDHGVPREQWESYNFAVQYLFRPDDWDTYVDDMIKLIRFWGVSCLPEDNVTDLRQALDARGYGRFLLYRGNFTEDVLKSAQPSPYSADYDKTVKSNEETINNYTRKLNTFYNRHGHRVPFPELLEQSLTFDPNETQPSDAVVAAGFTMIAAEATPNEEHQRAAEELNIIPLYDNSGTRSKLYNS